MPEPCDRRYLRHQPEETVLYQVVQQHLESFLAHVNEQSSRGLPRYVVREFRRYLECGVLAHGFGRAQCSTCGHEMFVAFSCKLRALCPSCNTRRMCETAANLVDHILPDVRLRQWVLSTPFEMRILLAAKPNALSAVGRIFVEEVRRWQKQQALIIGLDTVCTGAVCFPQRFGSSLNLNVHFH